MPKLAMRISPEHTHELEALLGENEELRREVAELKAQIAAIHAGVKAVLDAVGVPDIEPKMN